MSTVVLLVLVVPVLLAGLLATRSLAARRRPGDPETESSRRRGAAYTLAATALSLALVVVLTTTSALPLGLGQALAPLVAGGAMVAVILVHEATWPRATGPVRSASLRRRSLGESAPRWLLGAGAAGVVGLWALDVVGILVGDPNGRSLSATIGEETRSAGPFPGAFYAVPTLVVSLVVLLLVGWSLKTLADRRGLSGDEQDRASRQLSAHRILRGAAFGHLATLAGQAVFAGRAISSVHHDTYAGDAGTALAVLGLALGLAAVAALVIPSRAVLGLAPQAMRVS
ncbi:MAG: hypothetical protein JWP61_504 [Friedmanniella sp.]|nr:hypothetical protein [Friedmanniella sp.]